MMKELITEQEYQEKIRKIQKEAKALGCEVSFSFRDKDHLDCLWYGGDVGAIKYRGYTVVISAIGDIRLNGILDNGEEISFKDKCNGGSAYKELALTYGLDDASLNHYIGSDAENPAAGYLAYENNNWLEFDLITPDKKFIDLGMLADNVLEDNVLDAFQPLSFYTKFVDTYIARANDKKPAAEEIDDVER